MLKMDDSCITISVNISCSCLLYKSYYNTYKKNYTGVWRYGNLRLICVPSFLQTKALIYYHISFCIQHKRFVSRTRYYPTTRILPIFILAYIVLNIFDEVVAFTKNITTNSIKEVDNAGKSFPG